MSLKKLLTSVCIASSLCVFMAPKANAFVGTHIMVDPNADSLLANILIQEIADVSVKLADLNTFIDLLTSMGDPEQILSSLDLDKALGNSILGDAVSGLQGAYSTVKDNVDIAKNSIGGAVDQLSGVYNEAKGKFDQVATTVNEAKDKTMELKNEVMKTKNKVEGVVDTAKSNVDKAKNMAKTVIGNISVPAVLQEIGFTGAIKDSKQMANLISKELLPPIEFSGSGESMSDEEKAERYQKRRALLDAAVADAYALAVATQYEGTSVQEGSIKSAKNKVDVAETLQERAAASLDVGLARISQLVRGNEISAMSLRLRAAEAIANMPSSYNF